MTKIKIELLGTLIYLCWILVIITVATSRWVESTGLFLLSLFFLALSQIITKGSGCLNIEWKMKRDAV